MLKGKYVLNIFLLSLFEIAGQIFIKTYYEQDDRKLYFFFLGWLMYLGVVYFLYRSYSQGNFAITNAFWNAFTTVLVSVIGWVYYKEHLTTIELVGVSLVVLGFGIIGAFSDGGERSEKSEGKS